jgi:hypothetical protein
MGNPDIEALTEGAFKYGPFFFSILFVIFLTRWAYKKYNSAIAQNPPLDEKDKKINRALFLITFLFGIALVIVSIVWWWWFKPNVFVFKGEIQNLQPEDEIASDVYYLRRELRVPLANEDAVGLLRNEHFIIFRPKPFWKGQTFELDFAKNHQRRTQLWITYDSDEDEPVYEIAYDDVNQRPFLKRISQVPQGNQIKSLNWGLRTTVHASEDRPVGIEQKQNGPQNTDSDEKLIRVLQDSRSDVAAKLNAIDNLNRKDPNELKKDLQLQLEEPFALTIFDLTQHSDTELASKATTLSKHIDIDSYLVGELSSENRARRESAEKLLLRITRSHAQGILKRVDVAGHQDLERTAQDVSTGSKTQILKPTASLQGDRYYVKATWNSADEQTVSCLVKLFNSELITTRSLSEEWTLMQGKNQRFVFWYSKDWAIDIATKVKGCGGSAEFVLAY